MRFHNTRSLIPALTAVALLLAPTPGVEAEDSTVAVWGGSNSRNLVSAESGMPANVDPDGANLLWTEPAGSQSYGGPLIVDGKVLIGTNNEGLRNPKLTKDRGVVMAFDAKSGEFLWQMTHEKLPESKLHDWPLQGVCSTPAVEGDNVYYISNRAEVVAVDLQGFHDGENDGPIKDEAETSKIDGDVMWKFDMMGELDVFPHNLAAGSPLLVGDLIITVTGNGVDEGHIAVPASYAPSFIAVNKKTGELAWEAAYPGEGILHGSWSNPAYGVVDGTPQLVVPGGDGIVYSLEPETGEIIWTFDANPKDSVWRLGGAGTRNNIISTPVIWNDRVYIAVGQDPEHGEGPGNFWVIDATKRGEGENKEITDQAVIWHRGGEEYNRTISTVAIHDGIVYAADLSGFLYALDADTGEHHWTYDAFAAVWGSPYVVDGKVYLGDEDGDIAVLEAGKEMKLLGEYNLGSAVYTTPVAADGVLYILARNRLFAFKEGVGDAGATKPGK